MSGPAGAREWAGAAARAGLSSGPGGGKEVGWAGLGRVGRKGKRRTVLILKLQTFFKWVCVIIWGEFKRFKSTKGLKHLIKNQTTQSYTPRFLKFFEKPLF